MPEKTIESERLTFHVDFAQRAAHFGQDLLVLIPELESVAIVPGWAVIQNRLASGLIVGRNGPLHDPGEIVRMCLQLQRSLQQMCDRALETIQGIDQHMQNMAEEIRVKQRQLEELDRQLAARFQAREDERSAAGGTPAESA